MQLSGIKTIVIVGLLLPAMVLAQSPKKLYNNAQKLYKENKLDEAIAELNNAIQGDEKLVDAFLLRAEALEKLGKLDKAVNDFEKATQLDPKAPDHFYNTGRLYYKLERYQNALKYLNEAVYLDPKHQAALQYKIFTLIKLSDFQNAIIDCNRAIDINKKNHVIFYCKGVAMDSLRDFNNAEKEYQAAINLNANYDKAYNALSRVKLKKGNIDEALALATQTVEKFPNNVDGYLTRSIIYRQRTDYPNAINDLSKALTIQSDDLEILMTRGQYYYKFNQFPNAVSDFSRVITLDPNNCLAYLWRGTSLEEIMKTAEAISDYEKYATLAKTNPTQAQNLAEITKKLFELKRESQQPELALLDSLVKLNQTIELRLDIQGKAISGTVKDKSLLKSLIINDKQLAVTPDSNGLYQFSVQVTPATKEVKIEAVDVYDNIASKIWKVIPIEIDPPQLTFLTPFANENGMIYLNSNDPQLYIEAVIADQSFIKSVYIENLAVPVSGDKINPSITANIDVKDKTKISIKICDVYNNCSTLEYQLNREAINISQDNVMGKTWVVFIENSNYSTFASIEGPTKDVISMKQALKDYQIHNIIHKKDMSKTDLEKFFSIELRDLVRTNNVNSILVWYAGHGKFINETGYWIPVDAKRDEEFTYFNINSLKAGMQSYSKYLTHTLIVTDACESGPSFYQAMRSTPVERQCGDWTAGKFKSSQVFSSAGYELASDDSQFSKTFAKSLSFNTNTCIPIETIVIKVTEAVGQSGKQKPKFGKIQGLEDEDGTFFFMKK